MLSLSELKKFETATISKIDGSLINLKKFKKDKSGCDAAECTAIEDRLLTMGFIEGSKVQVMHLGPFNGNPMAVRVDNHNILVALSKDDASAILVERINV